MMPISDHPTTNSAAEVNLSDIAHLAVMDAHCAICARGARLIAKKDRRVEFRIVPSQADRGGSGVNRHGLEADDL